MKTQSVNAVAAGSNDPKLRERLKQIANRIEAAVNIFQRSENFEGGTILKNIVTYGGKEAKFALRAAYKAQMAKANFGNGFAGQVLKVKDL